VYAHQRARIRRCGLSLRSPELYRARRYYRQVRHTTQDVGRVEPDERIWEELAAGEPALDGCTTARRARSVEKGVTGHAAASSTEPMQ